MIHSVYKLPFNTHTATSIFESSSIGLPVPHSIHATSLAARFRLRRTLDDHVLFLLAHREMFTDILPVIGLPGWRPDGWSTSSLLSNLTDSLSNDAVRPLSSEQHSYIESLISAHPPHNTKVQRLDDRYILKNIVPRTLDSILSKRVRKYFDFPF